MNPLELLIYSCIPWLIVGLVLRKAYEAVIDAIELRRLKKRLVESQNRRLQLELLLACTVALIEMQKLKNKHLPKKSSDKQDS